METGINGPRNTRKPWEEKEAHLPDNLGINITQKAQQRTQEVEAQNPVQLHLGLQEQARVKWTPRMHLDSNLGPPPIHEKLTKRSTCSPNMGPFGPRMGVGAPGGAHADTSQARFSMAVPLMHEQVSSRVRCLIQATRCQNEVGLEHSKGNIPRTFLQPPPINRGALLSLTHTSKEQEHLTKTESTTQRA
jgi:hypothetical protein